MLQRRLFSLNIQLSKNFVEYIEKTNHLCIYKLGNLPLPTQLSFPNVQTVVLINCNKYGVNNILRPTVFPNLRQIHYLRAHPGSYDIHNRFQNNIHWVFPNKKYDFYEYIMSIGIGKKKSNLISTYIVNKQLLDGKNDFDISYKFDLQIPDYDIVDSEWYKLQFYEYLVKKHNDVSVNSYLLQELEELHLQQEVVKNNYIDMFDTIEDKEHFQI